MRRSLLLLLSALALTACAAPSAAEIQSAPLPPAAMLESTAEPLHYTVELETWERSSQAEDGTPLVSCTYALPVLTAVRSDGTAVETASTEAERRALAVTESFNREFAAWTGEETFDELTLEAQADLDWRRTEDVSWTTGYVLDLDCQIYQTDELISVAGTHYNFLDGAAHPNIWRMSWNFDLEDGTFFAPDFLAESSELQTAVTEEIIRQANEPGEDGTVPAEFYWEDYRDIAANWSTAAVTFDEAGMTVIFSPYELAAYGFGEQVFHFSYDFLRPYLSDHGLELLGLAEEPS